MTINSHRAWGTIVRHVHLVTGEVVINDTGGLEPRTAAEVAEGYPDGYVIRIDDTITSADITLRGASKPTIDASATALAKTTFNGGMVMTVASAASITVQPYWKRVNLTGSVNVGTIPPVAPGTVIILSASSTPQILSGGNIKLRNNIRFAFEEAADRLVLECDGTNWNELARSRNGNTVINTTPTPTPGTGSLTSGSVALETRLIDDMCFFTAVVSFANAGTAGGPVSFAMPYTSASAWAAIGVEVLASGLAMTAAILSGSPTLTIRRYDGGDVAATGQAMVVSGFYRVAT